MPKKINPQKALLIARAKQIEKLRNGINEITPVVYSAFALALSDQKYGWTHEQIEDLFADTQWLWNKCIELDVSMPEYCLEKTGIDVISGVTAEKRGITSEE